ncbi:MAG: hypothetical protein JSV02_01605, partial [Dehalococcoidia bacterium]
LLEGREFFISGDVYEPRFGLDEQPKFWVKRGYDLDDGRRVIIKLEFYEESMARFGSFIIPCYRSPEKESEVLWLVEGDPRFMQGRKYVDDANNNVRIIDYIHGKSIFETILDLEVSHKEYYHTYLSPLLQKLMGCFEAIQMLHEHDLYHGDIRNDHIMIEDVTGEFRWIDFDLCQDVMFDPYSNFTSFDVWSFGNVLQFVVGMGLSTFHDIRTSGKIQADVVSKLRPVDASAFHNHRLMNLKKIYPYISERLNDVLLRFSIGTEDYYWTMSELMDDICRAIPDIPEGSSATFTV